MLTLRYVEQYNQVLTANRQMLSAHSCLVHYIPQAIKLLSVLRHKHFRLNKYMETIDPKSLLRERPLKSIAVRNMKAFYR